MEAIFKRRSIRKYQQRQVSEELVTEFIRAGMYAPSAGNQQPWDFVVIRQRGILDEIPKFHANAQMVKEAPLAILVCASPAREKHKDFWVQDCSAATQNILLAVADKGLGAVWVGIYPRQERVNAMRSLLGIPQEVVPFSLIPIGYPVQQAEAAERFNPEYIHKDKW